MNRLNLARGNYVGGVCGNLLSVFVYYTLNPLTSSTLPTLQLATNRISPEVLVLRSSLAWSATLQSKVRKAYSSSLLTSDTESI